MYLWTALALGVGAWVASRAVTGWRDSRNLRLRRPVLETFTADGYFTQRVDFLEMQVLDHATTPDPAPGVGYWPSLHELRRLDVSRWEARPHLTYIEHRTAELRKRATRGEPNLRLTESERSELERLASGKLLWEEWGWGSRVEPAYQRFLREYRPASREVPRPNVPSLETLYKALWEGEADRVAAFEQGRNAAA